MPYAKTIGLDSIKVKNILSPLFSTGRIFTGRIKLKYKWLSQLQVSTNLQRNTTLAEMLSRISQ